MKKKIAKRASNTKIVKKATKVKKEITLASDLKEGAYFRATIEGEDCLGRVNRDEDQVYLCQDFVDQYSSYGNPGESYGFSYAYEINSEDSLNDHSIYDFEILTETEFNKLHHQVVDDIHGYDIKVNRDYLRLGCGEVQFTRDQVLGLNKAMKKLNADDFDILLDFIKEARYQDVDPEYDEFQKFQKVNFPK